jgi:hypothetical protein
VKIANSFRWICGILVALVALTLILTSVGCGGDGGSSNLQMTHSVPSPVASSSSR